MWSVGVFLGFVALAVANPVQDGVRGYKVADKEFLKKQKDVLGLFYHIDQPFYYKEFVDIANSYKLAENVDNYRKPEVVKTVLQYWKYNYFIPKGTVFSIFYDEHLDQAKALFNLFYYAKDYDTFFKTAVRARQLLNEGLFLYAYSVALVYRPDTYGIILPPIYETYPQYFFSSEVIQKAQYYKQIYLGDKKEDYYYTVPANYSGYYLNLHPEQSLSYYLEDIGINSFYYYYNIYYPFWLDGEEFKLLNENRGEFYYFVYQQLLARYYLERLSNGFGEIPFFNWEVPFETPYYPSLTYPNGLNFPSRPKFAKLYEYFYNYGQKWSWKSKYGYSYGYLTEYERRIRNAIDAGFSYARGTEKRVQLYHYDDIFCKEGINTLGGLIGSIYPESTDLQYYGQFEVFARHLLGYSTQPIDRYKLAPSALEHFETSLRDPAFYQLFKKIIFFFQRYKSNLPFYTEQQLLFPGVKVEKVEFDRLITYFDTFDTDITSAVYVTPEEYTKRPFRVKARQYRLNHKPFNYNIVVKSDKDVKSVVKVFLGPKFDEYGRFINISENRLNFIELDHFQYDLKAGENVIRRNSYENYIFGPDRISSYQLYKQVEKALQGGEEFRVDGFQNYFYFPQRYQLPRGTENGQVFQFYVYVYPFVAYKGDQQLIGEYFYPRPGSAAQYVEGYPLGYPFDRFIKFEDIFYTIPNGYFYETKIYHKRVQDVQGVN